MSRIFDFLKENIKKGSNIKIVTEKITLRAFYKLIDILNQCNSVKILLISNSFAKEDLNVQSSRIYEINKEAREMMTNSYELKLKNDLNDFYFSKQVVNLIKNKVEIKFIHNFKSKFILIDNNFTLINDIFELSMNTIDDIQSNDFYVIDEPIHDETKYRSRLDVFERAWNSVENSKDIKNKIINKLESLHSDKTPYEIYQYTNAHLNEKSIFNNSFNSNVKERDDFKQTQIYQSLFDFQKHAVESIIDKINKFNGCILADAVGLGKTYEALAVIKYYELQGKRVLVLPPKRLENNWKIFNSNYESNPLLEDNFNYKIIAHTDLSRQKGKTSAGDDLSQINWDNYDLIVIDESHNFRNDNWSKTNNDWKNKRYKKLMDEIILSGRTTNVLLLSATPVNNRMEDINSQIKIITRNKDDVFYEEGIKSIERICKIAERKSNDWTELNEKERTVEKFQDMIGSEFRKLIDLITISRSRKQIKENYLNKDLNFPNRKKPISKRPNIDKLNEIGNIKTLNNELINLNFACYKPADFILEDNIEEYEKEYGWRLKNTNSKLSIKDRENNLIALMKINLLKRFESSIHSFCLTIEKILNKSKSILELLSKPSTNNINEFDELEEFDDEDEEGFVFNKVKIQSNHLDILKFRQELEEDIESLNNIYLNYKKIDYSRDEKIDTLIKVIENKINNPINDNNYKVMIFTSYIDTAKYLYDFVSNYFVGNNIYSALITGNSIETNSIELKNQSLTHNDILTYFSPVSKSLDKNKKLNPNVKIDILIATDCISEGQNLQDCDYLINYDIHWNPVRLIQRFGRIDRIGSKNDSIQMINFWPNIDIEEYIRLESRVKAKMHKVSQASTFDENILQELNYEDKVKLKQLETIDKENIDIEDIKENISFSNMTFSEYSTDLKIYLNDEKNIKKITNQPEGIFAIARKNENVEEGVIFLFKSVSQTKNENNQFDPYYLIFINKNGEVKYSYSSTAKILSLYKSLTKDQKELNYDLIDKFNQKTNYGQDMSEYVELLNKSIMLMNEKEISNEIIDFFDPTKIGSINSNNNYVLVSFLIIEG
ncbi:MAG: DEAD/DEAH box helicase family protein [Mycoplasmataceae bacterium]|nr:DEAD/DEAH box helicase family protein [Mycoplasmataceae bacterium]